VFVFALGLKFKKKEKKKSSESKRDKNTSIYLLHMFVSNFLFFRIEVLVFSWRGTKEREREGGRNK
jgi:hypothetical protein